MGVTAGFVAPGGRAAGAHFRQGLPCVAPVWNCWEPRAATTLAGRAPPGVMRGGRRSARGCLVPAAPRRREGGSKPRPEGPLRRPSRLASVRRSGVARQLLRAAKETLVRKKSARSSRTLVDGRGWPTPKPQARDVIRRRSRSPKHSRNVPLQRLIGRCLPNFAASEREDGELIALHASSTARGVRPLLWALGARRS